MDYVSDSGIIVFLKNREAHLDNEFKQFVNNYTIKEIVSTLGIKVHGVLSAHAKKIGSGWTPFVDHAKNELDKLKNELDNMPVPDSFHPYKNSKIKDGVTPIWNRLDKNSELVKMIEKWKQGDKDITDYKIKADKYNKLVEQLKKIDSKKFGQYNKIDFTCTKNSVNYEQVISKRYPFIVHMDSWYCKVDDAAKVEYIEIMDKHLGPVK